jgi:hypothetical protein
MEQRYGRVVILPVYPSATGMCQEKYRWDAREIGNRMVTGWLPDDYQIADDLLLMIDIENSI